MSERRKPWTTVAYIVILTVLVGACGNAGSTYRPLITDSPATTATARDEEPARVEAGPDFRSGLPRAEWSGSLRTAQLLVRCIRPREAADPEPCFNHLSGSDFSGELRRPGEQLVDRYETECGNFTKQTFYYPACDRILDQMDAYLVNTYGPAPRLGDPVAPNGSTLEGFEPPPELFSLVTGQDYKEVSAERVYGQYLIGSCDGLFFDNSIGAIRSHESGYRAQAVVAREFDADNTVLRVLVAVFANETEAKTVVSESVDRWAECWDDPEEDFEMLDPVSDEMLDPVLDEAYSALRYAIGNAPESRTLARSGSAVAMTFLRAGTSGPEIWSGLPAAVALGADGTTLGRGDTVNASPGSLDAFVDQLVDLLNDNATPEELNAHSPGFHDLWRGTAAATATGVVSKTATCDPDNCRLSAGTQSAQLVIGTNNDGLPYVEEIY